MRAFVVTRKFETSDAAVSKVFLIGRSLASAVLLHDGLRGDIRAWSDWKIDSNLILGLSNQVCFG